MSILWRPNLFSAVGAGFYDDKTKTLQDGNHFRWHIDPLVGLPYETHKGPIGGFYILKLNEKYPCLENLDLQKYAGVYPYVRSLDHKVDSDIVTFNDGFYFIKKAHGKSNIAVQKMRNLLNAIPIWQQIAQPELKKYINYWNDVLVKFQSDYLEYNPIFEKAEVCAVQMTFKKGQGNTPHNDDRSSNTGCIGILANFIFEKKYALIKAYDKEGNLVGEDWIGQYAANSGNFLNRSKRTIRITALGISRIIIEPQAGQPIYEKDKVAWVNCEDYCNAPIWDLVMDEAIRFDPREASYSPSILQNKYYNSFKKTFNWNEVDQLWKDEVINNPDIIDLFEIDAKKSTYDLYSHTTKLAEETPSEIGFSEITIPLLPTLIQGATDTALASLLGLYRSIKIPLEGRDVMIGALPPFFEPDNLLLLYAKMVELKPDYSSPIVEEFFKSFLANEHSQGTSYNPMINLTHAVSADSRNRSYALGSLVLCDHLAQTPKAAPKTPSAFNTVVGAVDLPDNESSNEIKLFVDSLLEIPDQAFTRNPFENIFSYEVERNIGNTTYENAATDNIIDPLEAIGILPSIFTPNQGKEAIVDKLRDNFKLDVPPLKTVQYRLRGYDIFCRPTDWVAGALEDIPIPCHPPASPTNLSSQVIVEDGKVLVELIVSVDKETRPFQAVPDKLEIAIHSLDNNATGEVDAIQWAGNKIARGVTVTYGGSPHYPDTTTATLNCKSLNWVENDLIWTVNWTNAGNSCDATFPSSPFSFVIFATNTMIEADTNFRTFKLRIALGEVNILGPGDHRWCARIRVAGNCDGVLKYSKESCASIRHKIVAPPPPVVQSPVSIIPESTLPDKLGNSFYSINVAPFIPTPVAGSPSMVNIYRIDLEGLTDDISTLVQDNLLLGGQMPNLLNLAKASQMRYEKINEKPIEIKSNPEFYRIKVPGNLETYHVVGVVGCNPEREESAWENAAIILFKTPKAIPVPILRFKAAKIERQLDGTLVADVAFKANFETIVTGSIPTPKILLFRKDYHTNKSAFIGESTGIWNATELAYDFPMTDTTPASWRKYAYEANLLIGAEKHSGKFVKSKQKAIGEALAPGASGSIPLDDSFTSSITSTVTGFELSIEFLLGDFNISISKLNENLESHRHTGKINKGIITGLNDDANLAVSPSGNYQMVWNDNDNTAGTYKIRISRGQQIPWSIKLQTP